MKFRCYLIANILFLGLIQNVKAATPFFPVTASGTYNFDAGEYTAPASRDFIDAGPNKNIIVNVINGDTLTINMPGSAYILDAYANYGSLTGGANVTFNGNLIAKALNANPSDGWYYGRISPNHGGSTLTVNGDLTFIAESTNSTNINRIVNYLVFSEGKAKTYLNGNVTLSGKAFATASSLAVIAGLIAGSDYTALNTETLIDAGVDADSVISITNLHAKATGRAEAYGIQAYDNSIINLKGKTIIENITAEKTASTAGYAYASAVEAVSDPSSNYYSVVKFLSDLTIKNITAIGDNAEAYAMSAYNGGIINVNTAAAADRSIEIEGDVIALDNNARINIYLTNENSYLQGNTIEQNTGIINLNLINGGTWRAADGYGITTLNIDNGVVDTAWQDIASPLTSPSTVSIGNLIGTTPTFVVRTDFSEMKADLIEITNSIAGESFVKVMDIGLLAGGALPNNQELLIVRSPNPLGDFTALKVQGQLFDYTPILRETGTEVYVSGFHIDGVSPTAGTFIDSISGVFTSWRSENGLLRQRMGDLRKKYSDDNKAGAWVRVYGGELKNSGKYNDFKNNYTTTEIGLDKENLINSLTYYTGVSLAYRDSNVDYKGSGDMDSNAMSLSIYNTIFTPNNYYFDTILRGSYIDNNVRVSDENDGLVKGDYDNVALNLQLESGRKLYFKDCSTYIEPLAVVSYGWLSGEKYKTNNGIEIKHNDLFSLTGGAGLTLGVEKQLFEKPAIFYVRAVAMQEFLGDAKTKMRGSLGERLDNKESYDDFWVEYYVGSAFYIKKDIAFYADFETDKYGNTELPWQVNGGIRISF